MDSWGRLVESDHNHGATGGTGFEISYRFRGRLDIVRAYLFNHCFDAHLSLLCCQAS